jgi:N-formylglutamate amidohydrolase
MDGWAPVAAEIDDEHDGAAFVVTPPPPDARHAALVFATPHSGRIYPDSLMAASRLDAATIRRSEDAHVDALIAAGPAHGATVIAARMARAWMDVNREPWELDASMFEDDLPAFARAKTAKVAAGLGAIARVVGDGEEIYRRKLTFAEASARVRAVHEPYHAALAELVSSTRRRHGAALLIDWHSMPSAAVGAGCDVVLGDRFGVACSPAAPRLVERSLRAMGYAVARNAPYAGGYTTAHYGRPSRGVHALQIEINRALYMDERTLAPSPRFARLRADHEQLFAALAAVDWAAI